MNFKTDWKLDDVIAPGDVNRWESNTKAICKDLQSVREGNEKVKEHTEKRLEDFKSEMSAEQEKLNLSLSKAIKDIADSKGASETTFNADGSITTINSLETVTTTINKKDRSITSKHVYKNGLTKTLKTVFKGKQVITTEVE